MTLLTCCLLATLVAATPVDPGMSATSTVAAAAKAGDDDDWHGSTDQLDDAWVAKVLADPEYDRGWSQPCHANWGQRGESHCEVREFDYAYDGQPIAINGGDAGGMTVMGWDRKDVRVIYRVRARARTRERAQEMAQSAHLERTKGWLRPEGPDPEANESWSVEVKVWVPRSSDVVLRTHNGPSAIRSVTGTMEIDAVNGPVSIVDLGGAVQVRVQNGPLHVELTGSRWNGAGLDAAAENGPVNLVVPRRYSARLLTGTIRGPRSIHYTLDAEGGFRGHFVRTLGSGGPPVRVVTENGPFNIQER